MDFFSTNTAGSHDPRLVEPTDVELTGETQTGEQTIKFMWGFPGGSVVKKLPANAGDLPNQFDP